MKNKVKNLFLIILSSFLFILANPNFIFAKGIGFLAWLYYIPVLILIRQSTIKENIFNGFIYGFLCYAGYAFWLLKSYKAAYFCVVIVYGLCYSILFVLLKLISDFFKRRDFIYELLLICSFEYIKTLGFLGLNYGVTAYTQYNYKWLIQICDKTGPFGLNLLIIFPSCIFVKYFDILAEKKKKLFDYSDENGTGISGYKKSRIKSKAISFTLVNICTVLWTISFIFVLIYGIKNLSQERNYEKIKICAVQSNENPWENGINSYTKNVHKLIKLTEEALEMDRDINIVVWPETAVVPAIVSSYEGKKDKKRQELITELLEFLNKQKCQFVIGNGHEISEKGFSKSFNSALIFSAGKNVIPPSPEIYSKIHLVPFSESFPWRDKFPEIYCFLSEHGSELWEKGDEYKVFNYGDFYYSTPICFEDTFTDTGRNMFKAGARCFINLTNDSWSGSKVCQLQHEAMAIFRCVENRIPAVRCTTSGRTAFIDAKGKVLKTAPEFCSTYLTENVEIHDRNQKETFYTKTGDWCGYGAVLLAIVLLLMEIFISIIKKASGK